MQSTELPPWSNDPLSKLLADAQLNERAVSHNYPEIFQVLQHLNDIFLKLQQATEKDDVEERLIPRMLLVRGYSNCIAAIRLAMSGQLPECFAILRVAIEATWYALHLACDPTPPQRQTIWRERGNNPQATQRCRAEFSIGKVRATHRTRDPRTESELYMLYNRMIDGGGHPNQLGVLGMTTIREASENKLLLDHGVLDPRPLFIVLSLREVVIVGVNIFKIAKLIYPERCDLINLQEDIAKLVHAINTYFK